MSTVALITLIFTAAVLPAATADSVQPFFLSALNNALTTEQANYIGRFPLAVLNHKQGNGDPPRTGGAEVKQLAALQAIKAVNSSCQTHFYLNSQIDFPELALHEKFVQNPQWWMKTDAGAPVQHGADNIFDWSEAGARDAWVAAAGAVLSHDFVDGIFVDKAHFNGTTFPGVSADRNAQWNQGHITLILALRASTSKNIILNNEHTYGGLGMGQLFERWGAYPVDHDGLTIPQDMQVLSKLNTYNLTALARAGGDVPRTHHGVAPDPAACGAGLAELLVTITNPKTSFFSCATSFASTATTGWMTLLSDPIYSQPLGTPLGVAVPGPNGLVHRTFSSGTVAWLQPNATIANAGCVRWSNKQVSGTCPTGVPPQRV
eukprot:m.13159 g.13159  ORF g.13159 m.13159 type:complete len:376 (-) comp9609_c0_seq1:129-1256(-)